MSETLNRVLVALGLVAVLGFAALMQYVGLPGVYLLSMLIIVGMMIEFLRCLWLAPRDVMFSAKNLIIFALFLGLLCVDFYTLQTLGHRSRLLLMLFVVISTADICAWFFGRMIGGDKLWERISEHKTWAGQIFGVIGGTIMAVICERLMSGAFDIKMFWVGMGISLLSQYGDFTASFVKRKLKIKDFSRLLGGHGGIIDRFDGWVYVLPVMWLMFAMSK